jgi:hypothetical protein
VVVVYVEQDPDVWWPAADFTNPALSGEHSFIICFGEIIASAPSLDPLSVADTRHSYLPLGNTPGLPFTIRVLEVLSFFVFAIVFPLS